MINICQIFELQKKTQRKNLRETISLKLDKNFFQIKNESVVLFIDLKRVGLIL